MSYQTVFTAYLNANQVFIDLNFLPSTINYILMLTIKNQTPQGLYFKVVLNVPNWSLTSPSDGKLGGVGAGSSVNFTITISRANPNGETVDSGSITVEAYTDSNYTNMVGSASLPLTITFEDTEAWTNVIINNFDDGTSQGWSGGSVSSELSIEAGGYSYFIGEIANATVERSISKSVTLPADTKVRMTFYFVLKGRYNGGVYAYVSLNYIRLLVNNVEVGRVQTKIALTTYSYNVPSYSSPWNKITFNLSSYADQTVTITLAFGITAAAPSQTAFASVFVDRIVIAGKS